LYGCVVVELIGALKNFDVNSLKIATGFTVHHFNLEMEEI